MSAIPFIFASSFVSKPPLPQSTRTSTPRLSIATEAVVAGGGPAGLDTLAAALGEDPDTLETVVEPFLLQLGFLQRTPRGRVLTEAGRQHLEAA